MKNKILVVAAHPDDEVLGVGGTIIKHIKNGDQVSILILGDGETSRGNKADVRKKAELAKKVSKELGAKELFLENLPDNKFDSVSLLEIVKKIESVIGKVKPRVIYTHYSCDLNIDHRLTFQATLTAARPQPSYGVKKIYAFEIPSSTEWQIKDKLNVFCPNFYNDISKYLEKKIELMKVYRDELRGFPHPRSAEGLRILAGFRGMEIGLRAAEAFQLIREIND